MNQWVTSADVFRSVASMEARPEVREFRTVPQARGWNPESFAQEQIRGLVRQIFLSETERPIRQVVFMASEAETDVRSVCRMVGQALSCEDVGTVAVVGAFPQIVPPEEVDGVCGDPAPELRDRFRQSASRVESNLWLLPWSLTNGVCARSTLRAQMGDLRHEFSFSILESPPAGQAEEALVLGAASDGVILVLSARHTRRATARRVKDLLESAQVRILGIVLSDRLFPVPDEIYRKL